MTSQAIKIILIQEYHWYRLIDSIFSHMPKDIRLKSIEIPNSCRFFQVLCKIFVPWDLKSKCFPQNNLLFRRRNTYKLLLHASTKLIGNYESYRDIFIYYFSQHNFPNLLRITYIIHWLKKRRESHIYFLLGLRYNLYKYKQEAFSGIFTLLTIENINNNIKNNKNWILQALW